MISCNKTGCGRPAAWRPVIVIRPEGGTGAAPGYLNLALCEGHKREVRRIWDVLSDEGWDQIVLAFVSKGLPKPDRKRAGLQWSKIVPGKEFDADHKDDPQAETITVPTKESPRKQVDTLRDGTPLFRALLVGGPADGFEGFASGDSVIHNGSVYLRGPDDRYYHQPNGETAQ